MRGRRTRSQSLGPAFTQLVWARALIWIAGAITKVALPLAVYQRTGSPALAAILTAFESTPYLLVGLPAGALADRLRTRTVVITCCVVCGLASGSVPLAAATGVLTTPHLFVAGFAAGCALVFFDAAMFAVLPAVVPRDALVRAYSTTTAVQTTIALAGPAAGGVLAAAITPVYTLLLDSLMFACATVVFASFREPIRTRTSREVSIISTIVEGIRFIRGSAVVATMTLLGTGNATAEGVLVGMLIPTVVHIYGTSSDGGAVGLSYTMIAVGGLLGTAVSPTLAARVPIPTITIGGLLIGAAGFAGWIWAPSFVIGLLGLVVFQTGGTVVILNAITVRARLTPDALQGRVNTTARMVAWGGQPIGAYLAGGIVGIIGVTGTLSVGMSILLITAVAAACSPLRHIGRIADH
ncbi:MFS transporter [Williamsia sp. CHRR-6]|uniref:MFS transporter n=1 Tax=Williamsia sp. CHRR-6 TaxID=2835871 RepID=UPI001BDB27AE|nr:MFS transporter [Williamsia sp. CHRR-6]MBT0566775.1 MFS transporter [Williamsia sp. CHRR-6]